MGSVWLGLGGAFLEWAVPARLGRTCQDWAEPGGLELARKVEGGGVARQSLMGVGGTYGDWEEPARAGQCLRGTGQSLLGWSLGPSAGKPGSVASGPLVPLSALAYLLPHSVVPHMP